MTRKRQEAIFIGATSAEVLRAADSADRACLILAILDWAQSGTEPEMPPSLRLAWAAIRYESVQIAEIRKEEREYWRDKKGKVGKTGKELESLENVGKVGNGEKVLESDQEEKRREKKRNIPMSDESRACAREETPASVSSSESSVDILQFLASGQPWDGDPVEAALLLTGETSGLARGSFGKMLRAIGRKEFLDVLHWFAADIASGEAVRNRGAALTDNLKARAGLLGIKL